MIIRQIQQANSYRHKREALAGKGSNLSPKMHNQKSFEDYLLDAFSGEVVKERGKYNDSLSVLARSNLDELSRR